MTELSKLRDLYYAARRLRLCAPVDDDFPQLMHEFDNAILAVKPYVDKASEPPIKKDT